ncbi:MAG: aminotransferase class V-fold PLP-dependent enzyme [Pseudobdellovibrionaceae bacterium]
MANMIELKNKFAQVRNQFPALTQKVHGKDLVYLDSAATTLKPLSVIERVTRFYSYETANVHRGAHFLSDQATGYFEQARKNIADFIGAKSTEEVLFVKGTTEGINLVAQSWGQHFLKPDDEVVISEFEHHANIVPWQEACAKTGAQLRTIKFTAEGDLDYIDLENKITSKTKLVAITACSNTLGTLVNIPKVIAKARSVGALVLVDGAQIVSQKKVDVSAWDCDFFVFSAHKIFAPFGFGVVYAKKDILEKMHPYQFGGSMISKVKFSGTTYNDLPFRFEAGTPHVEGAVGLDQALQYVEALGFADIHRWENHLLQKLTQGLKNISGVRIFADLPDKGPIVSFLLEGAHPSDLGQILDQQGIAVRAGHHCTQPLMDLLKVPGTVRASLSIYNNEEDIERLIAAIEKAKGILL